VTGSTNFLDFLAGQPADRETARSPGRFATPADNSLRISHRRSTPAGFSVL
jgi:hypothetical protein